MGSLETDPLDLVLQPSTLQCKKSDRSCASGTDGEGSNDIRVIRGDHQRVVEHRL